MRTSPTRIAAALMSLGFAVVPVVAFYVIHIDIGRAWALFYFAAWLSDISGRWLASAKASPRRGGAKVHFFETHGDAMGIATENRKALRIEGETQ